jgi:MTH538 TIR-like domain (DUF1863)
VGFESLSQLVQACRWKATRHARRRRVFVSFHVEDRRHVDRLFTMARDPELELDLHDASVREPIRSEKGSYVRTQIAEKINRASVVICLVGDGTGWREWVDWEIEKALSLRKGLIGVRIPHTFGRWPRLMVERQTPTVGWDHASLVSGVEWAAACRS